MSEQAQMRVGKIITVEDVPAAQSVALEASVEGVDYNVPLTSSQKLNLTNIRLRRVNLQRQIAELQTQEAKVESYFHSELMKIAIVNKIDMDKFVLDDSLTIKPMPPALPSFGQPR